MISILLEQEKQKQKKKRKKKLTGTQLKRLAIGVPLGVLGTGWGAATAYKHFDHGL